MRACDDASSPLSIAKPVVAGAAVSIRYANLDIRSDSWIGFAPVDAAESTYAQGAWIDVDDPSGTATITPPRDTPVGNYELRAYRSGAIPYGITARCTVSIGAAAPGGGFAIGLYPTQPLKSNHVCRLDSNLGAGLLYYQNGIFRQINDVSVAAQFNRTYCYTTDNPYNQFGSCVTVQFR